MKHIYIVPLPEAAQTGERDDLASTLKEAGVVGADAIVEQLSTEAADVTLEGQYRLGEFWSRLLSDELEALADSQYVQLPLYRPDASMSIAGYYEIAEAAVEPAHATADVVMRWDLDLTLVGSHETHWSAVTTDPAEADHEFGNDTDSLVAVPDAARKRRWYDRETGDVASVGDPVEIVASEFGYVAIHDVSAGEQAAGTDRPILLYELPFDGSGRVDARVYDTLGNDAKYLESDDGRLRQWRHVFDQSEEPEGEIVIDNGLLRVRVHEDDGELTAERVTVEFQDDGDDTYGSYYGDVDATMSWEAVGLDWASTKWELLDWDLEWISPTVVRSQSTWVHPDEGLYSLDSSLHRGWEDVLWTVPQNEDPPIPTGLEDVLDPIASGRLVDPQPERELIRRPEVRR